MTNAELGPMTSLARTIVSRAKTTMEFRCRIVNDMYYVARLVVTEHSIAECGANASNDIKPGLLAFPNAVV